ncbi:MAG: formate dehydrogenase accessory sulfurtransferase FdhD [Acidobacteria bacterium]|nr:formate dehydrogenase accessory sulfurtransferase FdhD [Acidobacteriota bacterium]
MDKPVTRVTRAGRSVETDRLTIEEPCEIRLGGEAVAVTMRMPGHDRELAAGFLYTETIVGLGEIATISACLDEDALNPENVVEVTLVPGLDREPDWHRNFYATSSCGICGKASIDAVRVTHDRLRDATRFRIDAVTAALPTLREAQPTFDKTGGVHAAGLVSPDGEMLVVREDVGRHNAIDKIIGWAYLNETLPLSGHMLVVSGRQSFEVVQKALVAGIPLVAGVSAASSLAVDLAVESGMTLIGFVRGEECVVYSGAERLI